MVRDETKFREHLAELRRAARGLGGDIETELKHVEKGIERMPSSVGRDAEVLAEEIEYGLLTAAVKINKELHAIPAKVSKGAKAIGSGAVKLGKATKRGVIHTKKAVKKDVKRGFARAAGIKTGSISEWKHPVEKEK